MDAPDGSSTLVGIEPTDGEVLWKLENAGWEDCVVGPDGREFLCAFSDGSVALLDPGTGQQRELARGEPGVRTFVVATTVGAAVVQELDARTIAVRGFGPEGTERYSTTYALDREFFYVFKPVEAVGGQLDPSSRPRLERVDGRLFVVHEGGDSERSVVIDVSSATLIGSHTDSEGWAPVAASLLPEVVDQVNWSAAWQDNAQVRHPLTNATLGVSASAGYVVAADVAPGYSVVGWSGGSDWAPPRYISALVGGDEPVGLGLSDSQDEDPIPDGAAQCPAETFLLAFASFRNGSITVCGYHLDEPNLILYRHGGQESTASEPTFDGAFSYRGKLPGGGSLRLAFDLGTYEVLDGAGEIAVQGRADLIWFVALGRNQPATGQFDVPLPDATAQGQVGYLAELLARSKEARSSLVAANTALLECSKGPAGDYTDEISMIDAVTSNRASLLAALASAPVDLVPDGQVLLGELRVAIRHSMEADIAFAAWAREIQRDGCTGSGSEAGTAASQKATAAKKILVTHWNSAIASRFPVTELVYTDV